MVSLYCAPGSSSMPSAHHYTLPGCLCGLPRLHMLPVRVFAALAPLGQPACPRLLSPDTPCMMHLAMRALRLQGGRSRALLPLQDLQLLLRGAAAGQPRVHRELHAPQLPGVL